MSSHNSKFICSLLSAGIVLVLLSDETVARRLSLPPPPPPIVSEQLYCYFPERLYVNSSKCYEPYTQGPCEKGEHLVVTNNKEEVECVKNPCGDNKVPFQGSCYTWDNGPCGQVGDFRFSPISLKPHCDCPSRYYEYVKTGMCYKPFTQGPCEKGQYLTFLEDEIALECVENPCGDNEVLYKGSCYSLDDSQGPCGQDATFEIHFLQERPTCTCHYGYLHYVENNNCYKPYTQGPCEKGKYVVLPENAEELECVENPCSDNKVPYKGSCYSLDDTKGPCNEYTSFGISNIHHKPDCIPRYFPSVVRTPCLAGYKTDGNRPECIKVFDSGKIDSELSSMPYVML